MPEPLSSGPYPLPAPPDRSALLRHLAICAAALVAYAYRDRLKTGNEVLVLLAAGVLLNLVTSLVPARSRWSHTARFLSSLTGVVGWTALSILTGGVRSPFVAGFSLEILLSGATFSPLKTSAVTLGGMVSLWLAAAVSGGVSSWMVSMHTGLLVATGIATGVLARRWSLAHLRASGFAESLVGRLKLMETQLEDARRLQRVGGEVARLAHALKNAVHSLRGFAGILESRLLGGGSERRALQGLRESIDRLEEVARSVLGAGPRHPETEPPSGCTEIRRVMEEVVEEMALLHPGVRWLREAEESFPPTAMPRTELREVLTLLAQNAAEATGAGGEVALEARSELDAVRIEIRDTGPGIPLEARGTLFRPGATGKPEGSGFGLYLARSLVEGCGGTVSEESLTGCGAVFTVRLPALALPGHPHS